MPSQEKSRSLSIYLLKKGHTTPQEIFSKPAELVSHRISLDGREMGQLYIKRTSSHLPAWLDLFAEALDPSGLGLANASAAAVFVADVGKRRMALPFGYGWMLLNPSSYEENCGLKITLNAVDPDKIRSIDRVTFDAVAPHSQVQATRETSIGEFGLDVEQDLLREVTGTPRDATLAIRLTGKDSLHISVRTSLRELPELLRRILAQHSRNDYKQSFPWVDQVKEVRDPGEQQELEAELLKRLKGRNLDGVWLAPPERVEWSRLAGFKYRDSKKAPLHPDLHITEFLDESGDVQALTVEDLKKRRALAVNVENDLPLHHWPIYRCIYAQFQRGTSDNILNNGKWYKVASDFRERIDDAVNQIPQSRRRFPDFEDADEEAYNQRVAQTDPATFALLDRDLITMPDHANPIEFCDLYSSDREIIHVKRYEGSASLSHLFSQGMVAGTLFHQDASFRQKVNAKLPRSHRLTDFRTQPRSREYKIVFAIVSRSARPLVLPFFSKVNLRNAYRQLSSLGYSVKLAKIAAR
jgi:uncharacterized protein (TIGR04141 family)